MQAVLLERVFFAPSFAVGRHVTSTRLVTDRVCDTDGHYGAGVQMSNEHKS